MSDYQRSSLMATSHHNKPHIKKLYTNTCKLFTKASTALHYITKLSTSSLNLKNPSTVPLAGRSIDSPPSIDDPQISIAIRSIDSPPSIEGTPLPYTSMTVSNNSRAAIKTKNLNTPNLTSAGSSMDSPPSIDGSTVSSSRPRKHNTSRVTSQPNIYHCKLNGDYNTKSEWSTPRLTMSEDQVQPLLTSGANKSIATTTDHRNTVETCQLTSSCLQNYANNCNIGNERPNLMPGQNNPNPGVCARGLSSNHNSKQRTRRNSLDDYSDPDFIAERIAEINVLIQKANAMCNNPDAMAQALDLFYEIEDKNNKLGAYLVLNGIESAYWSTCISFSKQAKELKQAISSKQRRRQNSLDDYSDPDFIAERMQFATIMMQWHRP